MDDKGRMLTDGRFQERRRRANKGRALRVNDFFFLVRRARDLPQTDPVFHDRKTFT